MFRKYFLLSSFLSLSLGIFLGQYFFSFSIFPLLFFIVALILILFSFKYRRILYLILGFLILGLWRYQLTLVDKIDWPSAVVLDLKVQVISNPENREFSQRFKVRDLESGRKFLVFSSPYPSYSRNEYLRLKGLYQRAETIDRFDYEFYLRKDGIEGLFYYPEIESLNQKVRKTYLNRLDKFKEYGQNIFDQNLSLDSAALIKAMLLGDKFFLSEEIKDNFSHLGLSHIIAISGLHISLLSSLLFSFLSFVGLSRRYSFFFFVAFLFLYLNLIAFPASACRAALMGFLSFLALYWGRQVDMSRALFCTGIVLLLINPLLLLIDIAFQLSFLAVLGIIYIHPIIKSAFRRENGFIDIISISLSVQIISAPVLLYNFKQISLIAPIANLLILWTLAPIMSLSLIALAVYFLIPFLSQALFLVVELLFNYIFFINNILVKIPLHFVSSDYWFRGLALIYYLVLSFWVIKKQLLRKNNCFL